MGAYYAWVNATKMEHLGNDPFPYGVKLLENCRFPNERTDVALTLLANRWRSDLVAYVSDYTNLSKCEGPGLLKMAAYFPENPRDYVEDHGLDVGGLFSIFKDSEWYFPTEDDPKGEYKHPYVGPLDQEAVVYRYVVNEAKEEYIDRFQGRYLCTVNGVDILEDVTPALLSDTSNLERNGEIAPMGLWVGDMITPTNSKPDVSYKDVTSEFEIWDLR